VIHYGVYGEKYESYCGTGDGQLSAESSDVTCPVCRFVAEVVEDKMREDA